MIESFVSAIRNLFAVPELRRRVLFTLGMLAVYRAGFTFPFRASTRRHSRASGRMPPETSSACSTSFRAATSGESRSSRSALCRISPRRSFCSSSASVNASLKKLQEEGELGAQDYSICRYLTVLLCLVQGFGIAHWLETQPGLVIGGGGRFSAGRLSMTTGTVFIMDRRANH